MKVTDLWSLEGLNRKNQRALLRSNDHARVAAKAADRGGLFVDGYHISTSGPERSIGRKPDFRCKMHLVRLSGTKPTLPLQKPIATFVRTHLQRQSLTRIGSFFCSYHVLILGAAKLAVGGDSRKRKGQI